MDRLFRPQYLTVALLMVICLALMTLVLPRFPDKVCNIPLWVLIFSEYLFAIGVSCCAQLQSLRQSFLNLRLAPGLISLGIALLITAIGMTFSPINGWAPDGTISIGVVQLTIVNLAMLFSIFIITRQSESGIEEVLTPEESNAANSTNIKRLTQIRIKAIHNKDAEGEDQNISSSNKQIQTESRFNSTSSQVTDPGLPTIKQTGSMPIVNSLISPLQGLVNRTTQKPSLEGNKLSAQPVTSKVKQSTTRQAVDISTVEKLLIPPGPITSQNQKPVKKEKKELPPELRRLPSVNPSKTQNKIDQTKRPISSTISKLQALSASGTGAAHITNTGVDSSDLKSVLDRLVNDEEKASDSEEIVLGQAINKEVTAGLAQIGQVSRQSVDEQMDSLFAKIAPEAKPEISRTGFAPVIKAPTGPESKTESLAENKEEPRLFKEKVDDQVEEIFSGMVSAEAQKEISKDELRFESKITNDSQSPDTVSRASLFGKPIDKEMDSIFAQMAPGAKPEIGKANSVPESKTESPAENKEEPRLFKEKVDDQVEEIFSGMVSAEAQKEVNIKKSVELDTEITGDRSTVVASFDASVSDQKSNIPELKDFGRLSSRASADRESVTQAGTMKTIGKLLIDSSAVENIIKKGEVGRITVNLPSAKVISELRGHGIQSLLKVIDTFQGVEGSMLVGEDGLVISSTLKTIADREGTGVLAYSMLGNSNIGTQKLDLGKLEQMIMITNTNEGRNKRQLTTVLTDVDAGVLAVFLDVQTIAGLDHLIEKISSIANG